MGIKCLQCKYILVKCKLYGPIETIENASAIFEKKRGGFKCLNEIYLIMNLSSASESGSNPPIGSNRKGVLTVGKILYWALLTLSWDPLSGTGSVEGDDSPTRS